MTHITIKREVLEQAIEALTYGRDFSLEAADEYEERYGDHPACESGRAIIADGVARIKEAITALRTALEAPNPPYECKTEAEKIAFAFGWWKALEVNRTALDAREPLTEDEIRECWDSVMFNPEVEASRVGIARAIEAAHGIRKENT